jgi:hypothetical protein
MEKAIEDGPSNPESKLNIKKKTQEFETIIRHYLESNPALKQNNKTSELEIRFGTNPRSAGQISKIDYDNVVKQLYACGFKTDKPEGLQILRIQNEYADAKTGTTRMSNIRAEIVGTDMIREYCRTNSLQKLVDMPSTTYNKMKFTQKMTATTKTGEMIRRLDMEDFNFRVSSQTEQDYNIQSNLARNIISKWTDSKKMFRCLNRVRFYHDTYPIFADLSIVKMSRKTNRVPVPQYTIQEAGVFDGVEQYEIELEVDNMRVGNGTPYNQVASLLNALRKCIRIVLGGLQGTKYPIPYNERDDVLQAYMRMIYGAAYEKPRRIYPKDFLGPASYTLQMENIIDNTEPTNIPNIRNQYTVTEKADGERKLLYIREDGRIYMIDTNMNVIFTGSRTTEKTIFESLVDGEHIKYDKHGTYINLYAAFDVYFIHKTSVRDFAFCPVDEPKTTTTTQDEDIEPMEETKTADTKYRLVLLQQLVELLKPKVVRTEEGDEDRVSGFSVKTKAFEHTSPATTIFDGCSKILSNIQDGLYEYNTDGLIFTPATLAVGAGRVGEPAGALYKTTWEHSFKWKPPEFNTIDFLVTIKRDKTGKDEVHHIFESGRNLQNVQEVVQYKTLVLRCGFDERKHGFLNPCQDILNDNLPSPQDLDNEDTYKPVPFQPTNPFDPNACYANILLKDNGTNLMMLTEEGEYFEEDMIVEFKYVMENEEGWRWIPLRVRYDKTAELRAGQKNYGNAYHVANNNWESIHHPITEEMISTGKNIPEQAIRDDVYYHRSNAETSTRSLRDFHNLYVKKNLILAVSGRGETLIDYAVGKAGDLSKWIRGKLSFVFGIDISKDNIFNQMDGACSRFLKERKKHIHMPRALFVNGNSGLNIRNGDALFTEKDKQITNAVFGRGPKDATLLGKGVYRQYGVGENGFNVSSCQFAMHYFFENKRTIHHFLRNLAECTKVQGHFVGTCYDGKRVFDILNSKNKDESITIFKNEQKIYEITKLYDQTGFPDDELSLGYPINVYQESINQTFREYLVNFDYFVQLMEDYGFVLVKKEQAQKMDMPDGTGLFTELFTYMETELKRNPKKVADYGTAPRMTKEEKQISFMNRYFMFQKVRNVDTKKIAEVLFTEEKLMEKLGEENIAELAGQVKAEALIDEVAEPIVRKIKRKIVLKTYAKPSPVEMANPPEGLVANPERMANQPEGLVAKRGPSIVIRRPKP